MISHVDLVRQEKTYPLRGYIYTCVTRYDMRIILATIILRLREIRIGTHYASRRYRSSKKVDSKNQYSLRYFKYPEQPDATEYGNAKRRHHVCICKYRFGDRADHDEAIETIEQRDEVTL